MECEECKFELVVTYVPPAPFHTRAGAVVISCFLHGIASLCQGARLAYTIIVLYANCFRSKINFTHLMSKFFSFYILQYKFIF